jgi:hypothetical protein
MEVQLRALALKLTTRISDQFEQYMPSLAPVPTKPAHERIPVIARIDGIWFAEALPEPVKGYIVASPQKWRRISEPIKAT